MASGIYNQFLTEIMKGTYNLNDSDTVQCALLDNSHSFDATAVGWATVKTNEISGTGYTGSGSTLASTAVTQDDVDNEGVFDAANVQWQSATFSAYHAVIWDDTPSDPADPLICSIDFGGVQTVTNGTFTIQWDDEGIINIGSA